MSLDATTHHDAGGGPPPARNFNQAPHDLAAAGGRRGDTHTRAWAATSAARHAIRASTASVVVHDARMARLRGGPRGCRFDCRKCGPGRRSDHCKTRLPAPHPQLLAQPTTGRAGSSFPPLAAAWRRGRVWPHTVRRARAAARGYAVSPGNKRPVLTPAVTLAPQISRLIGCRSVGRAGWPPNPCNSDDM